MQLVPRRRRSSSLLNQFFSDSFWDPFSLFEDGKLSIANEYVPSFDISETDTAVEVDADLPGYDPNDVSVKLKDGVLTVSGQMKQEKEEQNKKKKYYCKQCSSGSFTHSFALPATVEEEKVKCTFKNGKLKLTVPKAKDAQDERDGTVKIEVQ